MKNKISPKIFIMKKLATIVIITLHLMIICATLPSNNVDLCINYDCICVNTTARKTIHCEGRLKGELPSMISVPLEFTEIDFSTCDIPAIPSNTFEAIYLTTNLVKLDFSDNKIEFIAVGSFEMFNGLRELILKRNKITNITIGTFRGLRSLQKLDLSYNNIQLVDMDVLTPCVLLNDLNLRYNPLPLIALQDLLASASSNLENLDLHGINLQRIPDDLFAETMYIRRLILSSNKLTKLYGNIFRNLKFLSILDLSDNLIAEITASDFRGMDSLNELYLNCLSQMIYIGEGAFAPLKHLRIFSCSFNPNLRIIHPGAFKQVGNNSELQWKLQEVSFRQNALTTLAEGLLPWEAIRYVDLFENPWRCDCNLLWMKKIHWNLQKTVPLTCETPRSLRNRIMPEIPDYSFQCITSMDTHLTASIVLLLSTLSIVTVSFCFFACWKLKWFNVCRAAFQNRYRSLKSPPDTSLIGVELQAPSDDTK